MAVEKAVIFDDLMKGEERQGFFSGGQGQSQRGGFRGGRRGKSGGSGFGGQGQSQRGGFKGGKRGKSESQNRGSKDNQSNQGRSRKGTTTTPQAVSKAAAAKTASKTQGQTRKGTTTTPQDVQKAADAINRDFNKATGFMTSTGDFLRDEKGNIVRSKTQVDRFNEQKKREKALRDMFASEIQAKDAPGATTTLAGLKGLLDRRRKALGTGTFSIDKLNQLKDINRALGDFDYTGMSIGNQLRAQAGDLAAGIPGLAKIGGALAGGPLGIAGLIASGGRGIAGLIADRLGIGQDDEDSKPTIADVSNERPGFLSGIASALRLGEGPGFTEERGGGGGQQPIIPPPTTGGLFGGVRTPIKKLPITTQPVDNRMLNQYLALAGFTPQQIQLMPESFRFLS